MKANSDQRIINFATAIVAVIIALVPFHAFLTVWGSSFIGHYTALRLWEIALLVPAVVAGGYLVWTRPALWREIMRSWLWRLIGLYLIVQVVWAAVALWQDAVNLKAVGYGVVVNSRFLIFFWLAWVCAAVGTWLQTHWSRLVLVPAAVVAGFALLQRFLLPADFLKHFGYGDQTIPAVQTIDHKVEYLRVKSTLRGPNFLGAYMIIILSVVAGILMRWKLVAAIIIGLAVLFLSGSRGAWIGALAALLTLAWLQLPSRRLKQLALLGVAVLLLAGAGTVWMLRDHDFVQNTVFHTDENSVSNESSNAAHLSSKFDGLQEVAGDPIGNGTGTAGPASVYNTEQPARIAENYFLQIGQEAGWLGLGLFAAIYVLVGKRLWQNRQTRLARALFAALIGITCMAMLMHVWVDETIAFLFWGLAGIALAPKPERVKS